MKKYDYVIIGFGKAGKTLAVHAKKQNHSVLLIEKDETMIGGTCINRACIPTKNLKYLAKHYSYVEAIQEKNKFISVLRGKNKALQEQNGVEILIGEARFESEHTLSVGEEIIAFEKALINTGSVPSKHPQFKGKNVFYSDSLLQHEENIEHLVILGGGFIGLEMASIYADFNIKVSLLERSEILKNQDDDIRESIKTELNKKITLYENAEATAFDGEVLHFTQQGIEKTLSCDALLIATSRTPNTASLQLEKAGIKVDEKGYILHNDILQTNNPSVYVAGDVKKDFAFTYISFDDYRILANQFFGDKSRTIKDRKNIPTSLFITPCFSRVGLSEKEAREQKLPIRVAKFLPANAPQANLVRQAQGLMKVVVHTETKKILGAALFSHQSEEVINLIKMAMDLDLDYTHFQKMIFTHPTLSENLNDLFAESNFSS